MPRKLEDHQHTIEEKTDANDHEIWTRWKVTLTDAISVVTNREVVGFGRTREEAVEHALTQRFHFDVGW